MEAVYFGSGHWANNTGASTAEHPVHYNATTNRPYGGGPWMGADLETGMYYGGGNRTTINNQSQPLPFDFVTGSVKGRGDGFTLKGADATKGTLTTMYDGPRPYYPQGPSWQPMKKQGAIVLATGGDQSNSGEGNFCECGQLLTHT